VKLLSIPLVNLISPFFILPKLADCWDAAADESIEGTSPPSGYGLAVTICIFRLIPIVNLAVIPFLVPIYLRRIDNVQAGISACQMAQ
jgi:uncharacterized protein involved in cysteine biosynthesis